MKVPFNTYRQEEELEREYDSLLCTNKEKNNSLNLYHQLY
jgi:hypothetical protein